MKTARQTKLRLGQEIYEIDLIEVGADQFRVNYRFGTDGADLREGTKTVISMSEAKAAAIFDALVAEKIDGSYQIAGPAEPSIPKSPASPPPLPRTPPPLPGANR